ncbi:TPA: glycosyltransferase family 2 protein, partial [Streptococcus agalactiae]|nr:glycosyltransferase family 2 protein [Streptococcus agalactiae]
MKVSLVIPVYNGANHIKETLESIIAQTYPNLEILIIDDGSTDNTSTICQKYVSKDKRMKYIYKKNGGQSSARNLGVKLSTSNWIAFLDSDDLCSPFYIECLVRIQHETGADLVITGIEDHPCYRTAKLSFDKLSYSVLSVEETLIEMYYDNYGISPLGKLYSKGLLLKYPYPIGKIHEDTDTTYKLIASSTRIALSKEKTVYVKGQPNSTTRQSYKENMLYYFEAMQHNRDFILEHYSDKELIDALNYKTVIGGMWIV